MPQPRLYWLFFLYSSPTNLSSVPCIFLGVWICVDDRFVCNRKLFLFHELIFFVLPSNLDGTRCSGVWNTWAIVNVSLNSTLLIKLLVWDISIYAYICIYVNIYYAYVYYLCVCVHVSLYVCINVCINAIHFYLFPYS